MVGEEPMLIIGLLLLQVENCVPAARASSRSLFAIDKISVFLSVE